VAEVAAETLRLRLRTWDPEDRQRFFEVMNTPAVMRWLGGVQSLAEWTVGYDRIVGYQRDFGHTLWIVKRLSDGEMLGFCGLKRVNSPGGEALHGQFEVGWRFRESAWGQGYAHEAATASLDLAFERFGAPHVLALTVAGNEPSQRLMRRLGMRRSAELDYVDPRFPVPSEFNPPIVYRIGSDEWAGAAG
jgi:RimJ/RimL family protein N-acetyltransferase